MSLQPALSSSVTNRLPEAAELQRFAESVGRPLIGSTASPLSQRGFHIPFEHGAWWSFISTLLGGLVVALGKGAALSQVLILTLSLLATFLCQDWAQALLAAALNTKSQALSRSTAWQGWALASAATAGIGLFVINLPRDTRWFWIAGFFVATLLMGMVLFARLSQRGRGRRTLAVSSLMLALPALPFGALAFGSDASVFWFWIWPTLYYPAATLVAQSYIRGFPEKARLAGPTISAILALSVLSQGAWLPGAIWLVAAARQAWVIRRRWIVQPQGMPSGNGIRVFGREQAVWGVTLTLIWIVYYLS